jgi:hypothetical protein
LLDAELPSFCQEKDTIQPILKKYQFFIKEEPHAHWEGYVCRTWAKTKKIVAYFFGSYGTTFTTFSRPLAEKECWEMAQYYRCVNNIMEGSADSFSFTASPEGDGVWMQTKEYSVINSQGARIKVDTNLLREGLTINFGLGGWENRGSGASDDSDRPGSRVIHSRSRRDLGKITNCLREQIFQS